MALARVGTSLKSTANRVNRNVKIIMHVTAPAQAASKRVSIAIAVIIKVGTGIMEGAKKQRAPS